MTINTRIIATLLAAPAALALVAPAQAQTAGIAMASPVIAIGNTKAYAAANQQIVTTFKAALDQIDAKQKERQTALAQLDKNNDKQVDDEELAAAQAAKNPALTTANNLEQEINKLSEPVVMAQAYAAEQIAMKYGDSLKAVVAAKKVSVVLTPDSFEYAPPATDITNAVTDDLNLKVPTVPIAVPANWRPARQTQSLLQQLQQYSQYQQLARLQQQQQAAGAAGAKPAAAPAAGKPAAKPAEPR